MTSRWTDAEVPRGDDYDAHFRRLEASGADVHGEAGFVERFSPARVLDAGCGTGRVAAELIRRGITAVGVDLDAPMLDAARCNHPAAPWVRGDLLHLPFRAVGSQAFDVVVAAGNVMIFLLPGTEAAVVARLADLLAPGGRLVCGFQLRPGGWSVDDHETAGRAVGLTVESRFSTWEGDSWEPGGDYIVSVLSRPLR